MYLTFRSSELYNRTNGAVDGHAAREEENMKMIQQQPPGDLITRFFVTITFIIV